MLRPVPNTFGIDAQQLDDLKRRAATGDEASKDCIAAIHRTGDKHLKKAPVSVMDKGIAAPSGDKHDYVSLATYYWPNPKTPNGLPYVAHDGEVNPETKDSDYTRLRKMIDIARGAAASEIHAIIPYYSFGRSDKKDAPRISITARLVADLLKTAVPDGAKLALTLGRLLDVKDEAHYGAILVSSRKASDALRWAKLVVDRAGDEVER